MKAREYLEQARHLNQRIDSKLWQLASLRSLAGKVTSNITGMPRNPSPSSSRLEDTIVKITALEDAINRDIDHLVDLKSTIVKLVEQIDDLDQKTILEMRYLSFMSWDQIATELHFSVRWVVKKHADALNAFESVMAKAGMSTT